MKVHLITGLAAAILAASTQAAPPQGAASPPPDLPRFAPAAGTTGYQEIRLADDTWYLAFYGERANPIELVQTAWAARAAQLCDSAKRPYFVQLKYVSESVLKSPPAAHSGAGDARAYPTGGAVYVPIFIPQPSHGVMPAITTPSKLAALRCIDGPEKLLDPSRAVSTADALASARTQGFKLP